MLNKCVDVSVAQEPRDSTVRTKALATSIGLSVLFLVVYGGCNWVTAQRSGVGTFYFQWERGIPFVPFLILPYMSIDLFFVAAPFFCRGERELRVFTRRVGFAIIIAGICFLLFPLRFAFSRPAADGWPGAIFDWFRNMDAPFNLVPSLHAALWLILIERYVHWSHGIWRSALIVWFALIALSPVLTHQHHVIDIVTGLILGGYCLYFFPGSAGPMPVRRNARVGSYYLFAALALCLGSIILWPAGILLLWPALSLALVSGAYFCLGPGIFRKTDGRLPWSTWFALGPCLAGQYISFLYYRQKCQAWNEVTPNIWIGRKLNDAEATAAVRAGVNAVLDLSAEFSEAKPFRAICYKNIPILDLTAPSLEQLREMSVFLEERRARGPVYVHCKIGYSRSAAAVAAHLIMSGTADAAQALAILRQVRPSIVIRPEIVSALFELEHYANIAPVPA